MGERTNSRSIQGHRKEVRQLTSSEQRDLVDLDHGRRQAAQDFDEYVYYLYHRGVTQSSIAAALATTQQAIARRIRYREERIAATGDPAYQRPQVRTR